MKPRVGFVITARGGKLRGVGIEVGTPVEDSIAAMQEMGIDADVISALSGTSGVAKGRVMPWTLEPLTIAERVEAARHEARHPSTGRYHAAVPGTQSALAWSHSGSVHEALRRIARRPSKRTPESSGGLEGPTRFSLDEE